MSLPTFAGVTLFSRAAANVIGSPESRDYIETMPGTSGAFAQTQPPGPRTIRATGTLVGLGASPSAASQALQGLIRQIQALVGASGAQEYVGTDGHAYACCRLRSYVHGPIRVSGGGTSYTAVVQATASILQLAP